MQKELDNFKKQVEEKTSQLEAKTKELEEMKEESDKMRKQIEEFGKEKEIVNELNAKIEVYEKGKVEMADKIKDLEIEKAQLDSDQKRQQRIIEEDV